MRREVNFVKAFFSSSFFFLLLLHHSLALAFVCRLSMSRHHKNSPSAQLPLLSLLSISPSSFSPDEEYGNCVTFLLGHVLSGGGSCDAAIAGCTSFGTEWWVCICRRLSLEHWHIIFCFLFREYKCPWPCNCFGSVHPHSCSFVLAHRRRW